MQSWKLRGGLPLQTSTDENGAYTASYVAIPALGGKPAVAGQPITINVTIDGVTEGYPYTVTEADIAAGTATFNITIVSTVVTVTVSSTSFSADTPTEATVTATLDLDGAPVTDEIVTATLSPNVGTVDAVMVNQGDGTYTATYTSGGTAGNVTITATATKANSSANTTIAINAGPPAAIALTANPDTVSSLGSATITATVTDSNSNGVGGATLTATAPSVGTITEFAADPAVFGAYTATYTAPTVEAEATETITVSTDSVSGTVDVKLTPEPPIEVNLLTVQGTIYKEDGEVPADGVTVTVKVGSNAPQTATTDTDGNYTVEEVNLIGAAARTGDTVTVTADEVSRSIRLTNDILSVSPATATVNVTTNIVIPPRSVNVLEVNGVVNKEDGSTSAGGGLDVTVTVGSNSAEVKTDSTGAFSASFVDLLNPVATTGDTLSVVVSDGTGERGRNDQKPLSNIELGTTGSATVTRNVTTDIGLTSNFLAISGTVYLKNGDTDSVPASEALRDGDLTVVVDSTTRNWKHSKLVDDDGTYDINIVDLTAAVIETDDVLEITVQNEAGETVSLEPVIRQLSIPDLQNPVLDGIDIDTVAPARVWVLAVEGDVVELDGTSAGAGVEVTLTIVMDGGTRYETILTDAAGHYSHAFVELQTPVARTDDMLKVKILRSATGYFGYREIELRTHQLAYENQPLAVVPPMQLIPPTLRLGGLSIDTSYADQYYGYLSLEAIEKNPELLQLIPSGILHVDLMQNLLASLPAGFNPTPETANPLEQFKIDSENFGNGLPQDPHGTSWQGAARQIQGDG